MRKGIVPQEFKDAEIALIHKKGCRKQCKNYRPISLLSHVYKVFIHILCERFKNDILQALPETQSAYQRGRGTIEQIFSLQQMIEKSIEFNIPLNIIMVDFEKCFDTVRWDAIWDALEKTSMDKSYIHIIKQCYFNSRAQIRTDVGTTNFIKTERSVKQGDKLSCFLFCLVLAMVVLKTEEQNPDSGFKIGGKLISNLGYSDDTAILGMDERKLQKYFDDFRKNAKEVGLKINIGKTKTLNIGKTSKPIKIKAAKEEIEEKSDFEYLGFKISSSGNQESAVNHRIAKGWVAYGKYRGLLTSRNVNIDTKAAIYNTYVTSSVLYGMECIAWTDKLIQKMEVFQNNILRAMDNKILIDKVPCSDLREKFGITKLANKIKDKVLKLEKTVVSTNKGVAKACYQGLVQGIRSRGRPRKRWRDNIKEWR